MQNPCYAQASWNREEPPVTSRTENDEDVSRPEKGSSVWALVFLDEDMEINFYL